jgi:hypothetical protein
MADVSREIEQLREIIRKDLTSVGFIPTGTGVQLLAAHNEAAVMWLYCESVFVQLFNGRDVEQVRDYLRGPMGIKDNMVDYVIRSALVVRVALEKTQGNADEAMPELLEIKGAEPAVIEGIVEACIRTSNEFNIPWDRSFAPMMDEVRPKSGGILGCVILAAIAGLVIWGIKRLLF